MKRSRFEGEQEIEAIIFTEHNAEGVLASHNDAVVVTANIADFNVHCIFIDNESSIDILYFSVFIQTEFTPDQLSRFDILIQNFFRSLVVPERMIKLPLTVGTQPRPMIIQVNFLMVKLPSIYNAILSRPNLWTLKAVVSSYHLLVKFLTRHGVG
ncbi:uncharacterized protein [Elaeis guineensis]|uniref:uncharacterized protein n=1 Tax=Elaeis guineensis var. tenera TaxID=51953 RepID=UPI003C6D631C